MKHYKKLVLVLDGSATVELLSNRIHLSCIHEYATQGDNIADKSSTRVIMVKTGWQWNLQHQKILGGSITSLFDENILRDSETNFVVKKRSPIFKLIDNRKIFQKQSSGGVL